MDYPILLTSLQLAIALFQLKLDHFSKKSSHRQNNLHEFELLGEAIRTIEYALSETVAFVGQTQQREPNPRLAQFWRDASQSMRNLTDGSDLADLMFEKNLYWNNPDFYFNQGAIKLYQISLENVIYQLKTLRIKYNKLQKKINNPIN